MKLEQVGLRGLRQWLRLVHLALESHKRQSLCSKVVFFGSSDNSADALAIIRAQIVPHKNQTAEVAMRVLFAHVAIDANNSTLH